MKRLHKSARTMHHAALVPWRLAVLGAVVGCLGALIGFAPAAWLASAVQEATQGHVLLADAQGSVWRGSAQLLLTGGQGAADAAVLPGRMDWQLLPTLSGAKAVVHLPCCATQGVRLAVLPSWSQIALSVDASKVNLPASWLAGLGAPWNTLAPQGQLSLSTDQLQVQSASGRMRIGGQITLDLLGMSSRLSTLTPLGDYRLNISGGDVPTIALQTLQGVLQLSGSGQFVGSRIRFSGEASAGPEQQEALSNVLNIIGRRQGAKSMISLG
jgi:general secretion pathway protein N